MNLKEAIEIAGKVSVKNSKMPGPSYAISAAHCNVGGKLVSVENSVCSKCYALRLEKLRPNVRTAWENNYQKTKACVVDRTTSEADYAGSLAFQVMHGVKKTGQPYMRWFDSGDLINEPHLAMIDWVAYLTPYVTHYLPTKESKVVACYGRTNTNLIVRVSSPMIDQPPLGKFERTTTVHTKGKEYVGFACPARDQGNQCGSCRMCWNPGAVNISYPKH